jgi:hypothetical protein
VFRGVQIEGKHLLEREPFEFVSLFLADEEVFRCLGRNEKWPA